mmetsp:Transcript_38786/g.84043  ORF Transcript_38786/g.84043 Transcript_38786/m.84043 type:complete len:267 (+) Transcript_38786:687-1487(+)
MRALQRTQTLQQETCRELCRIHKTSTLQTTAAHRLLPHPLLQRETAATMSPLLHPLWSRERARWTPSAANSLPSTSTMFAVSSSPAKGTSRLQRKSSLGLRRRRRRPRVNCILWENTATSMKRPSPTFSLRVTTRSMLLRVHWRSFLSTRNPANQLPRHNRRKTPSYHSGQRTPRRRAAILDGCSYFSMTLVPWLGRTVVQPEVCLHSSWALWTRSQPRWCCSVQRTKCGCFRSGRTRRIGMPSGRAFRDKGVAPSCGNALWSTPA